MAVAGQPIRMVFRIAVAGCRHPQWVENMFTEKIPVRLMADLFDNHSQQTIAHIPVGKLFTWLGFKLAKGGFNDLLPFVFMAVEFHESAFPFFLLYA